MQCGRSDTAHFRTQALNGIAASTMTLLASLDHHAMKKPERKQRQEETQPLKLLQASQHLTEAAEEIINCPLSHYYVEWPVRQS